MSTPNPATTSQAPGHDYLVISVWREDLLADGEYWYTVSTPDRVILADGEAPTKEAALSKAKHDAKYL